MLGVVKVNKQKLFTLKTDILANMFQEPFITVKYIFFITAKTS